MLSERDKKQFALVALESFDRNPIEPIDIDSAITSLGDEVEERLALNAEITMAARAGNFSIRGVFAKDFAEKIFEFGNQGLVIAGIGTLEAIKKSLSFLSCRISRLIT